jgi:hypothetical protein
VGNNRVWPPLPRKEVGVRIYNPYFPARGPILSEDVDYIAFASYPYRRYFRNVKEKTVNSHKKVGLWGP